MANKKLSNIGEIRRAVADYMQSEGCGCCGNADAHEMATARLAKLLRVPAYSDKSGYDFGKFKSMRGGN